MTRISFNLEALNWGRNGAGSDVLVLVTNEVSANSVERITIPNPCTGLNLRFMSPYKMSRQERARFVSGGAS